MDLLDKLSLFIQEGTFKTVIRGGKVKRKLICPHGTKAVGNKCVRMSAQEMVKRSKAAKKTQKKLKNDPTKQAKIEKKRAKSIKKRHAKVSKDATDPGGQS